MPTAQQNYDAANQHIADPEIWLLEFWQEGSSTIERIALNTEDIVSNGNTYPKGNFVVSFPNSGDQPPRVNVTLSNINYTIGRAVHGSNGRIQCKLIIVAGDDYDDIIDETGDLFVIGNVEVNYKTATGETSAKADPQMPVPFRAATEKFMTGLSLK